MVDRKETMNNRCIKIIFSDSYISENKLMKIHTRTYIIIKNAVLQLLILVYPYINVQFINTFLFIVSFNPRNIFTTNSFYIQACVLTWSNVIPA